MLQKPTIKKHYQTCERMFNAIGSAY